MKLRVDYARAEFVAFAEEEWRPSPEPTVARKMLEREGDEVARATSIVRYAPRSSFPEHVHDLGEEFVVLEGVFQDEHGDFPAGTYVRNPPGTRHRPFSQEGCVIFVKLRQFARSDDARVVLCPSPSAHRGVRRTPLHSFGAERVELIETSEARHVPLEAIHLGVELLVLAGEVAVAGRRLATWDWLRIPTRTVDVVTSGRSSLWVKTGHFPPGVRAV